MSRVLGESDRDRGAGGLIRGCRVSGSFEAMRDSLTGAESPRGPRYAIWEFNPLADFLSDHTLTGQTPSERLREYAARWVQFAGSLWEWTDRATFALRYHAMAGRVGIFFLATAHEAGDLERLEGEVDVILRAHRLSETSRRIECADFISRTSLESIVIAQVRQHSSCSLWSVPENRRGSASGTSGRFSGLSEVEWREPRVIYPWWGPGGPFLLPMESLISQPVPCTLSIYLQPTTLDRLELQWLSLMAREAQSASEQSLNEAFTSASTRMADPAAGLAARLYLANLRRLSATPFLVTVHAAASSGRADVALSLASSVQSLVHEPAFERPQQEDERLPSGATVVMPSVENGGHEFQSFAFDQYTRLRFERPAGADGLYRMADLCDAQGASTVFRLPVSVRGGVPGVRVRQLSPSFHVGARELETPAGHLRLGEYHTGGGAFVPLRDLTKHTLVTGFTGSGKTFTVLQILHQLWTAPRPIPFLVIEAAKQEYRGLASVPAFRGDLRIFTLGNETCVPFRLNPFELIPGVRVEAHLSKLQTCFEAAIPPVGPSASIIAEALQMVYERFGWRLTDQCREEHARAFPELRDFIDEVKRVLDMRDYQGEVRANVEAALVGRFRPLLLGSKGAMFGTQRSHPPAEDLFRWPTVLEMNDLNLDDKALVSMFILTQLREYRDLHRSDRGDLLHVTMVEEAHNVLEEVKENAGGDATSGDARHKAVQAFCSLLTEIRALGEGLIIADQSPMKLARDAMRNTNLQIAHQLRDGDDRKAIANAMIMESEQRDFLGKLPPGHAAMFRTGLEKATFVRIDEYHPRPDVPIPAEDSPAWGKLQAIHRGLGFRSKVEDSEVRGYMRRHHPVSVAGSGMSLPFPSDGCQFCRRQCEYRDSAFTAISTSRGRDAAKEWYESLVRQREETGEAPPDDAIFRLGARAARLILASRHGGDTVDGGWCALVHATDQLRRDEEWRLDLTSSDRECFDRAWSEEGSIDD